MLLNPSEEAVCFCLQMLFGFSESQIKSIIGDDPKGARIHILLSVVQRLSAFDNTRIHAWLAKPHPDLNGSTPSAHILNDTYEDVLRVAQLEVTAFD